jgi:AAA+ lid domain
MKALAGTINLSSDVDLTEIGTSDRADGYSGADCAALFREAGLAVLKEIVDGSNDAAPVAFESDTCLKVDNVADPALCIAARHFAYAFDHVIPSVSRKDQARYNRMRDRMAHARSRGAVVPELAADEGEATDLSKDEVCAVDDDGTDKDGNATIEEVPNETPQSWHGARNLNHEIANDKSMEAPVE